MWVIIQKVCLLIEIFCCTVDEVLLLLPVTALRPKIFVKRVFSAIVFINAWLCIAGNGISGGERLVEKHGDYR